MNKKEGTTLSLNDVKNNSILIEGEKCGSVIEFAPRRMLYSTDNHIFNLKDWKIIQTYENTVYSDIGNFGKMGFFLPLPGFDLESFPFIIVSARESIKIINVNEESSYMEPLINTKPTATYG